MGVAGVFAGDLVVLVRWETRLMAILLRGLVLWTVVGLGGSWVTARRGERRRARRGVYWIAGMWAVYLVALLGTSLFEPGKQIAPGREQCFGAMCFAVDGADELKGFEVRGEERERLVRVRVRVTNRTEAGGRAGVQGEASIRSYLVDADGRRWDEVPGLSGVRLTTAVGAGRSMVSEPVFRVPKDARGLGLVLTHGRWQRRLLVIGDPESWRHQPTVLRLEP